MQRAGVLRLLGLTVAWGSNFLFMRVALDGFSPVQITLARLVLGALTLLVVLVPSGGRVPRGWTIWGHFMVAALGANAVPYWLFAWGEQLVPSSVAGALAATTPLWTVVVAVTIRADAWPSPVQLAGLVIGFAGSLVIVAPWTAGESISLPGAAACVLASVCYGISFAYMARFLTPLGLPALELATGQLIAASGLLLLVMPFAGRDPVGGGVVPVLALLALGIVGTGVAYVLNYRIIADDGPTVASTVGYLLPIVSIGLGAAILDEPAGWNLLLGTVTVLVGVTLVRRRPRTGPPVTARSGEVDPRRHGDGPQIVEQLEGVHG
jgi:drug/metabolite transporter (DMT)-like permease